jgi:ribonuclease BN (tRNA processing enzyme)
MLLTPQAIARTASAARVSEVVLKHQVPAFDDASDMSQFLDGLSDSFNGQIRLCP